MKTSVLALALYSTLVPILGDLVPVDHSPSHTCGSVPGYPIHLSNDGLRNTFWRPVTGECGNGTVVSATFDLGEFALEPLSKVSVVTTLPLDPNWAKGISKILVERCDGEDHETCTPVREGSRGTSGEVAKCTFDKPTLINQADQVLVYDCDFGEDPNNYRFGWLWNVTIYYTGFMEPGNEFLPIAEIEFTSPVAIVDGKCAWGEFAKKSTHMKVLSVCEECGFELCKKKCDKDTTCTGFYTKHGAKESDAEGLSCALLEGNVREALDNRHKSPSTDLFLSECVVTRPCENKLKVGATLELNQFLEQGTARAEMLEDGNFVVKHGDTVAFSTETSGVTSVSVTSYGVLVVTTVDSDSEEGSILWSSNPSIVKDEERQKKREEYIEKLGGVKRLALVLHRDGSLTVSCGGIELWKAEMIGRLGYDAGKCEAQSSSLEEAAAMDAAEAQATNILMVVGGAGMLVAVVMAIIMFKRGKTASDSKFRVMFDEEN